MEAITLSFYLILPSPPHTNPNFSINLIKQPTKPVPVRSCPAQTANTRVSKTLTAPKPQQYIFFVQKSTAILPRPLSKYHLWHLLNFRSTTFFASHNAHTPMPGRLICFLQMSLALTPQFGINPCVGPRRDLRQRLTTAYRNEDTSSPAPTSQVHDSGPARSKKKILVRENNQLLFFLKKSFLRVCCLF